MGSRSFLRWAALSASFLAIACAGSPKPAAPEPPKPKGELYYGVALLVIDVQNGIFPIWHQEAVLGNINALVAKAEEANVPVIYVYHSAGSLIPGDRGWYIHEAVKPPEGHEQVRKFFGSAFTQTELEALLDVRRVGRVVGCGLASEGCVSNTLLAAMSKGYDVVLASDAHSTMSINSEAQIDRVNANLRGWGIEILPVAEIQFR